MYDIMTFYTKIFGTPEAEGSFYVTSSFARLGVLHLFHA